MLLLVFGNRDGGSGPILKMLKSIRFVSSFILTSELMLMGLGWIALLAQRYHKHIAGAAGCTHRPLS